MDCGTLTNPQNGQVTFTTTTFLSTANYSCNSGYTLSGNETHTCEATGTWSDTAPTCDRKYTRCYKALAKAVTQTRLKNTTNNY